MDIRRWTEFLGWCTLINLGVLILATLGTMAAGPNIGYPVLAHLFGVPEAAAGAAVLGLLAGYRALWFFFNLVPWVALKIVQRRGRR